MIDIEIPEELQNIKKEMSSDGDLVIFENGKVGTVVGNKFKECQVYYGQRGYAVVSPYLNGKQKIYSVHRLIAQAFIENPESKPAVNHKDGNKSNNELDNLEWVTHSENTKHAHANGLIDAKKNHVKCDTCEQSTRFKDAICSGCRAKEKAARNREERVKNRVKSLGQPKSRRLTEKQKEVFDLAKEGLSVSEIAGILGKTKQAVSRLLISAKAN